MMSPGAGERLQRYVGDAVRFTIAGGGGAEATQGWRALLRTNLGRAATLRREIIESHTRGLPPAGSSWRDIPMRRDPRGWHLELPLCETGFFQAKAYLVDPGGWQHWPTGPNVAIAVHPDFTRTGNTLYCAFPRLLAGHGRGLHPDRPAVKAAVETLDREGYVVIPESGKLRDLIARLPHITDELGCRFLQLLPINPTPTTYARFGRFGSPYAALDLTAIDPALVVFDKRTTGVDQFRELTYATHCRGARLLLDIAINHTGWGSSFQEAHPEWFVRKPDGEFVSPGAWGVTWEDLVELKHDNIDLWDELAEVFLTWCRRGVDGFRCDAGYMVPVAAWQYIIARVQEEYPETLFFLEGLGGAWEATAQLLGEGGMQWAYSELFQNYAPQQLSGYLDHHFRQQGRTGLLVHFSETHDNERLAKRGRSWSLLRNRLCALASTSGAFAFTSGVEWLATEKVNVHQRTSLAWGNPDHIIPELAALNRLLATHPAFFDGASVRRLSAEDHPVLVLHRVSAEGKDPVLVVVNNDVERPHVVLLGVSADGRPVWGEPVGANPLPAPTDPAVHTPPGEALAGWLDLLGQAVAIAPAEGGRLTRISLPPGSAYCLAPSVTIQGLHGESYRSMRARAAWAYQALNAAGVAERLGPLEPSTLARWAAESPDRLLAAIGHLSDLPALNRGEKDLEGALEKCRSLAVFPQVIVWSLEDRRRVTPVPPDHWLLVEDAARFRATLRRSDSSPPIHVESIHVGRQQVACFPPQPSGPAELQLERYDALEAHVAASVQFLPSGAPPRPAGLPKPTDRVLLTNGRGGMARLCVDLGRVQSKYDCVLGANLHPEFPVDRHVLAKRLRVWVSADGFISPLDYQSLARFEAGPPAVWDFVAQAGDGRTVQIRLEAEMAPGRNTTRFRFTRPSAERAEGKQLPATADVHLTVRVDIEDRGFHGETQRNPGADHHFSTHTHTLAESRESAGGQAHRVGFRFTPAPDRQLMVAADAGNYHPSPEWSHNVPHPLEQSRGQVGSGDAYSPGWFELPLPKGASCEVVVTAEGPDAARSGALETTPSVGDTAAGEDPWTAELRQAIQAFVVKRGAGKTVVAGYPWFLDWGRDTFIAARGLLAAGRLDDVAEMLVTFARFVDRGTLPNTIFGSDASNRDTSDAPLWFGVVCEELAALRGPAVYRLPSDGGADLEGAVRDIARHYASGTPNGIRMDAASGLVWSPSHFTWMDTNHPAATPRQGYPVEIQALWWRLLRQVAALGRRPGEPDWTRLSEQVLTSIEQCYWSEETGCYADLLAAEPGQPAGQAVADHALRSNCLFLVSLGLVQGPRARRCVEAVRRHLVVPGGLRSLAPLPVPMPSPIYHQGALLNDPNRPYWGRYEGDEDTRRKPAYHNGTAWTWTLPVFCEALARAWNFSPPARAAARAYLASLGPLLAEGCLGQLPEILDGDAPHTQRGCDAQAWSATEALRVHRLLGETGDSARPG